MKIPSFYPIYRLAASAFPVSIPLPEMFHMD